jgi:hypothetical protein
LRSKKFLRSKVRYEFFSRKSEAPQHTSLALRTTCGFYAVVILRKLSKRLNALELRAHWLIKAIPQINIALHRQPILRSGAKQPAQPERH